MSWKWFFAGFLASGIVLFAVWSDIPTAIPVFFLTTLASLALALGTNFGRGYWKQVGWSDVEHRPFNIPPTPRPRLGGFTTGYAVLSCIAYYLILLDVCNIFSRLKN